MWHLRVHECDNIVSAYMYMYPRQLIFLRKSDYFGCAVLLCLVVCLTLLASFFFPSHLSLKHVRGCIHVCKHTCIIHNYMYTYAYIHVHVCTYVHVCVHMCMVQCMVHGMFIL